MEPLQHTAETGNYLEALHSFVSDNKGINQYDKIR